MAVAVSAPVRAKGVNFRSFLASLERLRGPEAVEALLSALPHEIQNALRLGEVVASGWYPVDWYRELHVAFHKACPDGGLELSRQVGREAALDDFRGIYRFLLKVISTEVLVSQTPRVFRMYFTGGQVTMIDSGSTSGVLEFRGWHGFTASMWADVCGGVEGILLVRGAANVRSRVVRGGTDENLTVEYRWA